MNIEVKIFFPKKAVRLIWEECDRFDDEETGGRLVGAFQQVGDHLTISVSGILEAGPNARRTRTSFFQDGEYQERAFRHIEKTNSWLQHLGSWHTHHVNGLEQLSQGDVETYTKSANSRNHVPPFFYAMLITKRQSIGYLAKHYIFLKGERQRYLQIPSNRVAINDIPMLWPR